MLLSFDDFKKEFVSSCKDIILADYIEIEECSVTKPQLGTLTGIRFRKKGADCAPTFYIEELYEHYMRGTTVEKLSRDIVSSVMHHINNPPPFTGDDFDLLSNKEYIRIRLIHKSRNSYILNDIPYLDVGGGFVLIADVVKGEFRALITDSLLEGFGISKDRLFEIALGNSSEDDVLLSDVNDVLLSCTDSSVNLLKKKPDSPLYDTSGNLPGGKIRFPFPGSCMYVLTNQSQYWGASVLFYPGIIDRLHVLMGGNFYVLPSSVHELLIVPVSAIDDSSFMRDTIRSINQSVVSDDEVLADDLFICEAGRLRKVS